MTFICLSVFYGVVDDVVDKSDDNEESDSENETDNEDTEKDQCNEVRHAAQFIPSNLFCLCSSFTIDIFILFFFQ